MLDFAHAPLARHRGSGSDRGSDWADSLLRDQELAVGYPVAVVISFQLSGVPVCLLLRLRGEEWILST